MVRPNILRLLEKEPKRRLLDAACGEGSLARELHKRAWNVTGVDISGELIKQARQVSSARIQYIVDDAQSLNKIQGEFEALVCSLALMNIAKADKAMRSMSSRLVENGLAIFVVLHPAFRIPKFSHWYWEQDLGMQFRRVDRYLSPTEIYIQTHPGAAPSQQTTTYHRPINYYINSMIKAGLQLQAIEEWCSDRESEPGPRATAENTARQEFPVFLTLVGRKQTPID